MLGVLYVQFEFVDGAEKEFQKRIVEILVLHPIGRSGDAHGADNGPVLVPDWNAHSFQPNRVFLVVDAVSPLTDRLELCKERLAVGDGVLSHPGKPTPFDDSVDFLFGAVSENRLSGCGRVDRDSFADLGVSFDGTLPSRPEYVDSLAVFLDDELCTLFGLVG